MNDEVKQLVNQAVQNMLDKASSDSKISKLQKTHHQKIHFIPQRYRVFGGLLQSLNIQFGNFLEELMTLLIKSDGRYEILESYSGKKNNEFQLSKSNDILIDEYISHCQVSNMDLEIEFNNLLQKIQHDNDEQLNSFKHDIDVLFKNKQTGKIYYLECKYNDDHDTGKFVDINRKFIKTYAYLTKVFYSDGDIPEIIPILFFFNNKKMKGNIYVPEITNIYRGKRFFDEFLNIRYEDIDTYMLQLSESQENIEKFHQLYQKVINH